MNHSAALPRWARTARHFCFLLLVAATTCAPVAMAQDIDAEDEKPKPHKEWVIGYALATLPMAGAMYFMFHMNKRAEFKLKKVDGEEPAGH